MKKIAVIGAHGVGKTTLCKALASYAKDQHRSNVEVIGELARECPYPINQGMCYASAEWIILNQILKEREIEAFKYGKNRRKTLNLLICDRSAYDPYVYFKALNKFSYRSNKIFHFAISHLWTYDYFVYVVPSGSSIDEDGVRDTSLQLQYKIHRDFIWDIESLPAINKKIKYVPSQEIFLFTNTICEEIYSCLF